MFHKHAKCTFNCQIAKKDCSDLVSDIASLPCFLPRGSIRCIHCIQHTYTFTYIYIYTPDIYTPLITIHLLGRFHGVFNGARYVTSSICFASTSGQEHAGRGTRGCSSRPSTWVEISEARAGVPEGSWRAWSWDDMVKNDVCLPTWSLTARPWKMMVGRWYFPIGFRPIFRGDFC